MDGRLNCRNKAAFSNFSDALWTLPYSTSNERPIREIKLDVTWSYVKRQTAKMKLFPSVF